MEKFSCFQCDLYLTRYNIVLGKGNKESKLMIIGEAPGYSEDKQGVPFVGKAGKILDKYIQLSNLTLNDLYITNVVKCRPPRNRPPYDVEIDTCSQYLKEEIKKINPKIILLLGNTALRTFTFRNALISNFRGIWLRIGSYHILPTYHPLALTYNTSLKQYMLKDFKTLMLRYRTLINPLHQTNFNHADLL